jgi:hypothetical protein
MEDFHTVKMRVNDLIHEACMRSHRKMGDEEWAKHCDWVVENIIASAKNWIADQLSEGKL